MSTVARQNRKALSAGSNLLFSDDFNRTDRDLVGDNGWLALETGNTLGIVSEIARVRAGAGTGSIRRDIGVANIRITARIKYGINGSNFSSLLTRTSLTPAVLDFWEVICVGGSLFLREAQGGAIIQSLTTPFSVTPGSWVDVEILDDGDNISASVSQGATAANIAGSGTTLTSTNTGLRFPGSAASDLGIDDYNVYAGV